MRIRTVIGEDYNMSLQIMIWLYLIISKQLHWALTIAHIKAIWVWYMEKYGIIN